MRRIDAWKLREAIRARNDCPRRMRGCGVWRYQRHVTLQQTAQGAAWWDGVICCRARVCPPCFVARRFKLAREIDHVVQERERDTGAQSILATLTIRHQAPDPVAICNAVRGCWRSLLQSRAYRTWSAEQGIEWIAALEVTRGEHGWHPHIHALLLPSRTIDVFDDPWLAMHGDWLAWWTKIVARRIGAEHVPSAEHGLDLRECDSAAYLSKLGLELADPAMVKGDSPLALASKGKLDLYLHLQQSRSRCRDVTYSRALAPYRESLPEPAQPGDVIDLRGSEWDRLAGLGWAEPLAICETATRVARDLQADVQGAVRGALTARLGELAEVDA